MPCNTVVKSERLAGDLRVFWCGLAVIAAFLAGHIRPGHAEEAVPFELPSKAELWKLKSAVLDTTKGSLVIELYPEDAPWHVANFKYLADKGYYENLTFHQWVPGYILQGGDPKGTGLGGPGYKLPPEFSQRKHRLGSIGMLRKPDIFGSDGRPVNPGRVSSGSQFYIALGEATQLDGRYTIFGQVVGGIDVLKRLRVGDRIISLQVFVRRPVGGVDSDDR